MAYAEGRRSPFEQQPSHHSPQNQDYPESTSNPSPFQQLSSRPPPQQLNEPRPRSRANSARSDASSQPYQSQSQPQPINEAVNYAFDRSDAAHKVDPGLVAQITEQVINSLKASGFNGASQSHQKPYQPPPPPPPPQQSVRPNRRYSYTPRSPSSTDASIPPRFTPPSPHRPDHTSSFGSSDSTDSPVEELQRKENLKSRKPREKMPSPPPNIDGTSDRRSSYASHRSSISQEETTLEKIWQPLFDEEGKPTERLSSFLRGLAIHIIEDFEPRHSIVITPAKMLKFYELSRVQDERYPYPIIFSKIPNSSISRMYRELRCHHHLVQHAHHEVPTIPGLTTWGFEMWLMTMIRAHPDTEFERLAKCVLEMPISNADHRAERFPKELSRRLFPKKEDSFSQQRLAAAMAVDSSIPPSQYRAQNFPPPPSVGSTATASSFTERERTPYAGPSKAGSVASADSSYEEDSRSTASYNSSSSVQIERERKPYSAQVGGGKVYNEDIIASLHQTGPPRHNSVGPGAFSTGGEQSSSYSNGSLHSHTPTPTQKVPNPTNASIPNRSQSVRAEATMRPLQRESTQPSVQAAQAGFPPITHSQSAGIDIPPPPPGSGRHYRTNSQVGGRRPRSPSFASANGQPPLGSSAPGGPGMQRGQNVFVRSDGNMSEIPSGWYASNLHGDNAIDDDETRPHSNANGPGFGSGPGGMGRRAGIRAHAQSVAVDAMGHYGVSPGGPPPPIPPGSVPPMATGRDRSATAGGTGTPMGGPGMMGMDGRPGANGYEARGNAYDDDHPRRLNSNYFPPPPPNTRY
ncbi:hypothetical protein EV356DRAFT_528136 [Viridothelium virens]|uniref:DUF7514 domain-containing protein n=1 Tax=Viridothelium virens TaxID=1048519 RepID=A0A6A6HNG8_VIRVR|nr:hypothetical protein EV356DRAFT_528136 [Viridothelium virens]